MTTNSSTPKPATPEPTTRPTGRQNHPKRSATQQGDLLLKTTLVAGSIVATLWGTNLLANADVQQANTDTSTAIVAAALPTLPETSRSTTGITLSPVTVAPIPTVRAPQGTNVAGAGTNTLATVPNLDSGASAATSAEIDALLNRELPTIPSIQIPTAQIPNARASVPVTRSRSSR